ncbi:uncharacterized protein [Primulina eburnea]|uniref:uncharacterized protein n=1 Tax=Primulina eburnea TaxID=1245227 RepID=UPI003C6C5797
MEATGDLRSIDSVNDLCSETKIIQDFITQMKLSDDSHQEQEEEDRDSVDNHEEDDDEEEEDDDDADDEEEEEFTFMFEGANTPSMEAEDMKQVFPLFNRDVFFSGEGLKPSKENLPTKLPVKKVFVETDKISDEEHLVTSVSTGSDEVAGPFCEWSGSKAVVASSVACKKSNSTGFSKFWRFKDLVGRSCSDGKDTFVFLNKSPAPPRAVVKRRTREVGPPSPKTEIGKVRRIGRGKTAPLSAHAVYLKNKAKQEDRRRSYLPYRPELMGFFTNSNVGLTRNVHPY